MDKTAQDLPALMDKKILLSDISAMGETEILKLMGNKAQVVLPAQYAKLKKTKKEKEE